MIDRIKSVFLNRVTKRFANRGVLRDVAAVAGSRLIRQGVLMLAMAIAARMLGKELLGVWALIYIVIQFGVLLSDSGISTFVVQNRDLTERRYSTAFYLSTGLAVIVAAIIASIGIPLSTAFGFAKYQWLFVASATTVIPMAMNGLLQAKLRRDRRFTTILVSEVCASASLLIGVLWMLQSGFQLWAFVVPTTIASITGLVVCAFAAGIPRPTMARSDAKQIANYSLGLVGFSSVNYWARNIDHVLIGRFLGAAPLGIYSFAYRIMMLPLSQINATAHTVALPYLSPHQDDTVVLRDSMQKIFTIIGILVTLPMICLWIERDYVVRLVLGDQWNQVGNLLLVLAPLAVLQAMVNPIGLCYQVRSRTKQLFVVGMIQTAVTVLGFAIGVWLGTLMWVVVCYAIANLLLVPINIGIGMKTIDASLRNWLGWCAPFFALLPICWVSRVILPSFSSELVQLLTTCVGASLICGAVYAWVGRRVFTSSLSDDADEASISRSTSPNHSAVESAG